MLRFRRRPIPGRATPHKDVLAGHLQEARRANDHLRRAMREENAASKKALFAPLPKRIPTQNTPVISHLEVLFVLLLIFAHSAFASQFSTTFWNSLLFQTPVPALVMLLGYRLSHRASETRVYFYQKRYFTNILFPAVGHYFVPLAVVYGIYLWLRSLSGASLSDPSTLFFDFLYGRWANSSYYGVFAILMTAIFPLLITMRDRSRRRKPFWLLHAFFLNLLYEVFINTYDDYIGDTSAIYRILPFRMLFTFALGMFIYQRRKLPKKVPYYILSFLLGLAYLIPIHILLLNNGGLMPDYIPLFHGSPFTSMLAAFYIFPLLAGVIYRAQKKPLPPMAERLLSPLGNASYFILCAGFLSAGLHKALSFSFSENLLLDAIGSLLASVVVGMLLYLLSKTPVVRKLNALVPFFFRALRFAALGLWHGIILLRCNLRIAWIDFRLRLLRKKKLF